MFITYKFVKYLQKTENIHATHPHHIKSLTGYNITKAQGKTIFTGAIS